MITENCIIPDWPVPPNIRALTTLRSSSNKSGLKTLFDLPSEPVWLDQVHGATVIPAIPENVGKIADASFTSETDRVCAILTADCLPVFLCDTEGEQVALIHAGWRSLAAGIIGETLRNLPHPDREILAAFGPAIGPDSFEVGEEVRHLFINHFPEMLPCFQPSPTKEKHWLANLYAIAAAQLKQSGIRKCYGGNFCTFRDNEYFFSYRRDGAKTGRMISIIWKTRQVR